MRVQRWDATRDGVLTAHRLRQRLEAQGLWVTERRLPARSGPVPLPAVEYDVLYVVLTGLVKIRVGSDTATLAPGDTVFIPAGTPAVVQPVGSGPAVAYSGAFLAQPPGPHSSVVRPSRE